MLGKWIRCTVERDARAAFDAAQRRWSALAGFAGFRGQCGGFDGDQALILALWSSRERYAEFMRAEHDRIVALGSQDRLYTAIEVDLLEPLLAMPGEVGDLERAVSTARFLRVADCTVGPDQVEGFVRAQQEVWAPGMAAAEGMLAGTSWSVEGAPGRFLVTTAWRSAAHHAGYSEVHLPGLRERARPDGSLSALRFHAFDLRSDWTVLPAP